LNWDIYILTNDLFKIFEIVCDDIATGCLENWQNVSWKVIRLRLPNFRRKHSRDVYYVACFILSVL